jgi:hypothetical protein
MSQQREKIDSGRNLPLDRLQKIYHVQLRESSLGGERAPSLNTLILSPKGSIMDVFPPLRVPWLAEEDAYNFF